MDKEWPVIISWHNKLFRADWGQMTLCTMCLEFEKQIVQIATQL